MKQFEQIPMPCPKDDGEIKICAESPDSSVGLCGWIYGLGDPCFSCGYAPSDDEINEFMRTYKKEDFV